MTRSYRFDGVRNFSAMLVHVNNMFQRDVRIFAAATVFAGDVPDAGETSTAGVRFEYRRDSLIEFARVVVVPLHHIVGNALTVRLEFDARWILISEIQFESGVFLYHLVCSFDVVAFLYIRIGVCMDVSQRPFWTRNYLTSLLIFLFLFFFVGTSIVERVVSLYR